MDLKSAPLLQIHSTAPKHTLLSKATHKTLETLHTTKLSMKKKPDLNSKLLLYIDEVCLKLNN